MSWASHDNPQEQARLFASQMNCLKATMTKTAKCLRNLDKEKIAKSQRSASVRIYFLQNLFNYTVLITIFLKKYKDILHGQYALYAPTIELQAEDAFISEPPQNIIKNGDIAKVPWLVGVNSEEGLIYSARK